jgi:chemotaxis protein methyltransferase WspC
MAMAAMRAGWRADQVILDAVDRNERDVRFARGATYPRRALRDDAPDWADRWLHDDGQRVHVAETVTSMVNWIIADILRAPSTAFQEQYDIIFCRNLLIYLSETAREHLAERLAEWLSDRGLLFVGHAERTEAMRTRFEFTATPHAFALRAAPRPSAPQAADPLRASSRRGSISLRVDQQASIDDGSKPRSNAGTSQAGTAPEIRSRSDARPVTSAATPDTDVSGDKTHVTAASLSEARALADAGHLPEALRAIEKILADHEPNAPAYTLLGSVHLAMGRLDEARAAFLKSVYLSPRCEDTLLQLALVYDRQGDHSLATRYRRRAARVHRHTAREES